MPVQSGGEGCPGPLHARHAFAAPSLALRSGPTARECLVPRIRGPLTGAGKQPAPAGRTARLCGRQPWSAAPSALQGSAPARPLGPTALAARFPRRARRGTGAGDPETGHGSWSWRRSSVESVRLGRTARAASAAADQPLSPLARLLAEVELQPPPQAVLATSQRSRRCGQGAGSLVSSSPCAPRLLPRGTPRHRRG